MKAFALIGLMTFPILAGCDQSSPATGSAGQGGHGRYSGIGIYEAGELWAHVETDPVGQPTGKAGLADDEHVIVVVDNRTGEVRQCGNHSGICVAMNPWSGGRDAMPLPVKLTKNAADLDAELETAAPEPAARAPAN